MDKSIEYYKMREGIKKKLKDYLTKKNNINNYIIGLILLTFLLLIAKENGLFDQPTKYIIITIRYGSLNLKN